MKFIINDKLFDEEIDYSDYITIKSYNKYYEVQYIENTLLELINKTYTEKDFIIIDRNVYNLDKNVLNNISNKYYYIFDANENNKTMEYVLLIIDMLCEIKLTKKNKLIIIGGGITQDVGGFVSAIYKRGIDWILIPTTLLSITDSAIGGKVCLNRQSKNLLSVFYAPNKIYISTKFLNTLSISDVISGLGEALKLSLIGGKDCYDLFKKNYYEQNYLNIIKISSAIKKKIIEVDEFEKNERKILNYGHEIGHALESTTNYKIPHGIGVLIGMYVVNKLFYDNKYEDINNLILEMVPNNYKNIKISYEVFVYHLLDDKKNDGENICFILLNEIGETKITYININLINNKLNNIITNIFI